MHLVHQDGSNDTHDIGVAVRLAFLDQTFKTIWTEMARSSKDHCAVDKVQFQSESQDPLHTGKTVPGRRFT